MLFRVAVAAAIIFASYIAYKAYVIYAPFHVSDISGKYSLGPGNADLTVTEFLDYACSDCRKAHPVIMAAIKQDGDVKLIPRPLLSHDADASTSARLLYAAALLGKFQEAHTYLIENFGPVNEASLQTMADAINVDVEALKRAYSNPATEQAVEKNMADFRSRGGTHTPTFIIGEDIIYVPEDSMPAPEDLIDLFNQAREEA